MTSLLKKPDFLIFDGSFEDFYEEILEAVIKNTPSSQKRLFWQAAAHTKAKNITKDLLFEAITLSFVEKNSVEITRFGQDIEKDNGFFDFSFKNMKKPNIRFEYVGNLGLFLCFEESTEELSWDTLGKNKTVKKYLTKDEQEDLADYARCLDALNIKKADTICLVAAHLEKLSSQRSSQGKSKNLGTPMNKKHPDYYPLLEKRLLLAKVPKESDKNKIKPKPPKM